jgi:hypothetical protein
MMSIWAFLKPYFKVPGHESAKYYFEMFFFSALIMALSVLIAEQPQTAAFIESWSFGYLTLSTIGILIYPALLLVAAKLSDRWDQRRGKKKSRRTSRTQY